MRTIASVAFLLLVPILFASPASAQDVRGQWVLTVDSPQGQQAANLTLSFDSQGYLAGKLRGPQGEFTVSGEVVDEEICFGFTTNADGQELSIGFEGFWNESEMQRAVYFGEFGSGDWYATRK
jgi:hypothetical protein